MQFYRRHFTLYMCVSIATTCRRYVMPVRPISSLFHYFLIDARIHRLRLEASAGTQLGWSPQLPTNLFSLHAYFPINIDSRGDGTGRPRPRYNRVTPEEPPRRVPAVLLICLVYPLAKGSVSGRREGGTE